jgi:hypothetical protein
VEVAQGLARTKAKSLQGCAVVASNTIALFAGRKLLFFKVLRREAW